MTKKFEQNSILSKIESISDSYRSPDKSLIAMSDGNCPDHRADFAHHLMNYRTQLVVPDFLILNIYNQRFDDTETDMTVISDIATKATKLATIFNQPSLPFLMHMKQFWEDAYSELQDCWQVDALDLAVMLYQYQKDAGYKNGWFNANIRAFLVDKIDGDAATALHTQAADIIDSGEVIKCPSEFYRLMAVQKINYHNKIKIEDHTKVTMNRNLDQLNNSCAESADTKLKKAKLQLLANGSATGEVNVSLSRHEIEVLIAKTDSKLRAKQRRRWVSLAQ